MFQGRQLVSDMSSGQKRQFPYYSTVPSLEVKRRGVEGINPGQAVAEPAVHSFPYLSNQNSVNLLSPMQSSPHTRRTGVKWLADTPTFLAVELDRLCSLARSANQGFP